jgi:hypothetical protein
LDLRFADNKTLRDSASGSEMVTFTRASSGTYVGSDGVIRTAVTNEPRFDHNPTTGESLGLLVEESRTNLLLQSNQFDTTWTNTNSSETAAAGTAPDGTNTAWELKDTADAVSTAHSLVQSPSTSFTSGVAYTFSCWMKAGTLTEGGLVFPGSAFTTAINCRINLSTGAVISSSATVSASTVPYANGWYRVIATATATATATGAVNIRPGNGALSYIGTGTGTILVWGAQIEAGAFATSYIPTTTAAITRGADVITKSGIASLIGQTEGTIYAELDFSRAIASIAIILGNPSNENFRIRKAANFSVLVQAVNTPSGAVTLFTSPAASAGIYKVAFGYKNGDYAMSINGAAVLTSSISTNFPVNGLNVISLGESIGGVPYFNDRMRAVALYPNRLSNAELIALTTP